MKDFVYALIAFGLCGCATYKAVGQCDADLGTAASACIDAVQDARNRTLVKALGDEACARARHGMSDTALADASCEASRARAEKSAWVEIEKGAVNSQQPDLTLDHLVPPEPAISGSVTVAPSGQPEVGTAGPPTQESSSSASKTLVVNPPPAVTPSGVVGSNSYADSPPPA